MGDYDPTVDGEEVDLGEDDDQTPAHNTAVLQVDSFISGRQQQ